MTRKLLLCLAAVSCVAAPAFAGHNEWVASKKVLGVKICYAHYAEAHAIAVRTIQFNPLNITFSTDIHAQLTLLGAASASASVSTAYGKAGATSFSSGCSAGGSYYRWGLAAAGPGGMSEDPQLAYPYYAPQDSLVVDVVDIVAGVATVHVKARLDRDATSAGSDTLSFFAYPDTTTAKADVQGNGVGAIAGGKIIMNSASGTHSYPAVAGGNLFIPGVPLPNGASFLVDSNFPVPAPGDNVVIRSFAGGETHYPDLGVPTPALDVWGLMALVLALGAGGWVMLQRANAGRVA